MDRSPEVEQLAVASLAGMKAGNAVAVASLFVENEATTVIGNGADHGSRVTRTPRSGWTPALASMAESPSSLARLRAGPQATRAGSPISDLVFPTKTIPLRMTGVAIRQDGTWRLVQLHVSAAVSDEALLAD